MYVAHLARASSVVVIVRVRPQLKEFMSQSVFFMWSSENIQTAYGNTSTSGFQNLLSRGPFINLYLLKVEFSDYSKFE